MKKRALTILVILAVVFLTIAITLQISDSKELSTTKNLESQGGAGKIGVTVLPPQVEDKLIGNTNG